MYVHASNYRPAAKQEDDEMVLQIIYVFHQLTTHPATRQMIIRDTRELSGGGIELVRLSCEWVWYG